MQVTRIARLAWLAAPLIFVVAPAGGQTPAPNDSSNVHFGGMLGKHPGPAGPPPSVPAPPSAWPRLDPGAVICRSQDDLRRRAARMLGEQTGPADCQPITQPTAIKILDRAGPGATEVEITSNAETGWTDAWLPASPPPGITTSSR